MHNNIGTCSGSVIKMSYVGFSLKILKVSRLLYTTMTTKLQIRAPEEIFPSYRCGIEKTSSQMRTPDHQGGSNRLFSQNKNTDNDSPFI